MRSARGSVFLNGQQRKQQTPLLHIEKVTHALRSVVVLFTGVARTVLLLFKAHRTFIVLMFNWSFCSRSALWSILVVVVLVGGLVVVSGVVVKW